MGLSNVGLMIVLWFEAAYLLFHRPQCWARRLLCGLSFFREVLDHIKVILYSATLYRVFKKVCVLSHCLFVYGVELLLG